MERVIERAIEPSSDGATEQHKQQSKLKIQRSAAHADSCMLHIFKELSLKQIQVKISSKN